MNRDVACDNDKIHKNVQSEPDNRKRHEDRYAQQCRTNQ